MAASRILLALSRFTGTRVGEGRARFGNRIFSRVSLMGSKLCRPFGLTSGATGAMEMHDGERTGRALGPGGR